MCQRMGGGKFLGEVVRAHAFSGLVFNETHYPAHSSLPRHCHEHAYFCLIRAGTYREEYGRRQRWCEPRMLAFHPAEEVHAERFGHAEASSFNVEFSPGCLHGAASGLNDPFDTKDASLVGLAWRMYEEFVNPDASSRLIIEGLALQLLGHSARAAKGERGAPRWLLRVRELVTDRCTIAFTLSELAQESGIHPGHLAATFRRHFGCTVGDYARRQRVAAACRRLAETDASVAEIALATGFADQSHMTRRFREQVGLTPAAYRKIAVRPTFRSRS